MNDHTHINALTPDLVFRPNLFIRVIAWLLLSLFVLPENLSGSSLDIFGYSGRGSAMGNALTAEARFYEGLFYNPATLTVDKKINLGLSLCFILPKISFDTDNPNAPVIQPGDNMGLKFGAVIPLLKKYGNKLAIGVGFYLPVLRSLSLESMNMHYPQLILYENQINKIVVFPAIAYEITRFLSIGIGGQIFAAFHGGGKISLDVVNQRYTQKEYSLDLTYSGGVTAGILVTPFKDFKIGISYRQAYQFSYDVPITINIDNVLSGSLLIDGSVLYSPHQLNFGVSYTLPKIPLTLAVDTTWAMWSKMPNPHAHMDATVDLSPIGMESGHILSPNFNIEARDIWIMRIGFEYRPLAFMDLRLGYTYRPTPISEQTDFTNYVDSDTHVVSFGVGFHFKNPLQLKPKMIYFDLALQFLILKERTMHKSSPDDDVGNYTIKGFFSYLGFEFRHDF